MRYPVLEHLAVLDPETMSRVPADGETMGEVMFRGNTVMKGYLKDPEATAAAFAGGWFHSGDLGVTHPDGYIQIKDRSKDIIISGGENISSIEVEGALARHPAVLLSAVVAMPDEKWGETPCAFVELKSDAGDVTAAEPHRLLSGQPGPLQVPDPRRLLGAAENVDGEGSKVQAARGGEGSMIRRRRRATPRRRIDA